jgi:hypothetical protein
MMSLGSAEFFGGFALDGMWADIRKWSTYPTKEVRDDSWISLLESW